MTFPIPAESIETLCGRVINVSSDDKTKERRSILMHAEEDGDGNPFQFNLRPHDAKVLACVLTRIADVVEGRKSKKAVA